MHTLSTEGLTKTFGIKKAVDGVSLTIERGSVVGLLGPNGAGKTTTFYMMIGLIQPTTGKVYLDEKDITEYPMYLRARLGIGYLPQESSVFRRLSVEENIMAILETMQLTPKERKEKLQSFLKELDISHLAKNKAYSLSGGERRRLEITRALVTSPHFILLDEPFAGIDPIAVIDIQNIIHQLKTRGIGVIISDHNVRETLGVCDKAYILNKGKILEEGSPDRIANNQTVKNVYLGKEFRL